jgi:hypothetical protein
LVQRKTSTKPQRCHFVFLKKIEKKLRYLYHYQIQAMDFSFIVHSFEQAFGNINSSNTGEKCVYKSTVSEGVYFSLEIWLDLKRIDMEFEDKNGVCRQRFFFNEELTLTNRLPELQNESVCSILLRILQRIRSGGVATWAKTDFKKYEICRWKFLVEEFARLGEATGRNNYLIIKDLKSPVLHTPPGCNLIIRISESDEFEVSGDNVSEKWEANTCKLMRLVGWWFHNTGQTLNDWCNLPVKVFGLPKPEEPTS